MAYSRNEYLQSLNRMRANYQNQGNPLINREDDNGNVGNELSAFAYMETNPASSAPEQASKSDRNGWQRTVDTVHSGISNITEGVTNFLDDVWDFAVVSTSWLTGLFSGIGSWMFGKNHSFKEGWDFGTGYVKPATTFEWEHALNNWWNQMDIGHAVLSGDMFTGKWGSDWTKLGDKEQTAKVHQNSWASEWGDFGKGVQKFEQGVGYVLPSLVVAYFTGGASVGAQIGIQAGIAGGSALGGAFEKATKEGADYGHALGYGAIKGGISAGLTALTMGIGGNVASKSGAGIGGKIVDKVVNKGGSVIAGKIAEAGFRVTTSAGQTALMTAVEPLIQGITYDADAIEKAYGSNEAVVNTLKTIGENALTSAVITASISGGRLAFDVSRAGGVKNYNQQYWDARVLRESGMAKDINTIKNYNKSVERLQKQLLNGKITEDQFVSKINKLNSIQGEALRSLNEKYEAYFGNNGQQQIGNHRYALEQAKAIEKTDVLARDVAKSSPQVQIATMAKKSGMTNEQVQKTLTDLGFFKDGAKNFTKSGNTDFAYSNENGDITIVTTKNNNVYGATLVSDSSGKYIMPKTPTTIDKAMGVLAFNTMTGSNVPTTLQIKSKDLKVPSVKSEGINTEMPLRMSRDVSVKIFNKSTKKDIIEFLQKVNTSQQRNNYVMKPSDGKYIIVEPYNQDGIQKYGLITVNSKTNEIIDVAVRTNVPSIEKAFIVPKNNEKMLLETKLENKDGTAIVYKTNKEDLDFDWDVSAEGTEFSINAKQGAGRDVNGGFIFSKNPLKVSEFKEQIPFSKLAKTFNIPQSLSKTYELKLADKTNELAVLKWVGKRAGMTVEQVLDKLGYDSIVKSDNSVTFFNAGNILKRGVEFRYGQRSENYSDLIKRNVSESTLQKLAKYSGENGTRLETKEATEEYTSLVRETLSYKLRDIEYRGEVLEDVKIINEDVYTPDMKSITKLASSIGVKTSFALRMMEGAYGTVKGQIQGVGAFWSHNDKEIVFFIDSTSQRKLVDISDHELGHVVFDKLHGEELLNIYQIIDDLKQSNPAEFEEAYNLYARLWKSSYEGSDNFVEHIYEEMLCDINGRMLQITESGEIEAQLRKDIKALLQGGTRKANQEYYKWLAEDFRDYRLPKRVAMRKDNIVERNNQVSLGIAVTYELTSTSTKDILANVGKYKHVAMSATNEIAKLFGFSIKQQGAVGGWTWTDNSKITTLEGEPSFPVTIDNVTNIEDAQLFASLLADTALEVQNSVGVFEYDEKGADFEDTFYLKKINNKLYNVLKSLKVEGFTLYPKDKKLVIAGADDGIIEALVTELKNGDYYEKWETTQCNIKWLGIKERGALYKTWLKTHSREENGSLYARVKQAQRINNYIASNLDKEGHRLPETLSKVSDILEHLEKPTKIISDLKAKSSNVLIEAGADVSKSVKYRLESVKTAFDNALKEVVPDNGSYKISFTDTKQSFAELNLARPKDRGIAVDNLMTRLNNTKITLVSTLGEDTVKLGDLLTIKQEQQARDIMLDTLNGKAELTKLANWVKSLSLAKLETSAVKDHIKLANRLERRIEASSHLNFGYGNAPVPELTVFKNILNSVPRFWDNKGVLAFADSVLINYSDANIKPLLDQYGVAYDENIRAVADTLKSLIVPGRHLDPRVQVLADNLLRLLYNNLENLDASVKSENVKQAEYDANVIQSMGNGRKHDGKVSGTVKKVLANFDNSVTSVNDFLKRRAPGTNLQKFVENETGEYENKEIELNEKYENLLFKKLPTKEVKKLINKKFTFKGEKISYGVALDRLNSYKTLGDKFFNAKGFVTNADSTRGEVIYTPEDIANLEQAIPQALLDYNDAVLEVLNKELKADIKALYKHATHTELVTLDDNSIWYNISRVSDNFFGVNMGGVSMRDFNLSMFNQRVVSRADINFDLDLQAHLRAYLRKAFKVLVWTPYINKLNTLLNTRVYGVTNNKIYQQNIIGFDKQMDMLVHQVLGVPFETKVSTMSKVAGKVVGNLNAVRVATIQAGWRTVSSAPMFAKYFGSKVALQGQLQNLKNGDLFAFNKNLKIIKQYSPYLAKRFSSSEVALAETGVKVANTFMKIFGTPLRFGDASIHLTLGFAMAQVKAQQEGYGAPYTDSNNKRACFLLEQASKSTQPTNAIGRVAGFRYGNSVSKYLFGLYGSMKQVFYDALVAPIEDIITTKPRIEAMENAIKGHEAKIDEYSKLADEAKDRMDNASTDEEYKQAEKEYEDYRRHTESHEKAKKNTEDNLNDFKRTHTAKALFNRLSGALGGFMFASLMYVAIRHAISVLEGKKRVQDFTIKDFTVDVAEQAFMNSLPYLSTLYASIKNNSDLSIATLDNLNNTVDAIKKLVEAVESQNGGHITGATWNLLKEVSQYFGIPLSAMVRLVNGAWYNIDKGSNVDFHNWLGMLSGAKLRSNYSTAVKNGDKQTAIANLDVWASNHSIKTSDNVLEEIYRLNRAGETGVAPSAIPTKYTNEKGDEIKLTKAQINAFRSEYAKADKDVSKLLEVEDYKKQDDNTKASLIKRVYSAYRESAQARALGIAPNSKLGKLLFYTNGDVDMAKYIMSLQNLSVIKEDKKHTRKENVISAINKMAGFSKQEKLLLAYLSGYSVSEKNQNAMVKFLIKKGFKKKEAKAYLGLKK